MSAWQEKLVESWSRLVAHTDLTAFAKLPPAEQRGLFRGKGPDQDPREALRWWMAVRSDPQVVLDYAAALDRLDQAAARLGDAKAALAAERGRAEAEVQERRRAARAKVLAEAARVERERRGEIPKTVIDWGDE